MSDSLLVKYESAYGEVELSPEVVKKYLVRGQNVTDQEVMLFINLCKYQKLNPFINEAYLIKFGSECQMVVGYDTYKRRAEEHPEYLRRESGITVKRGEEIIRKSGQCVYPGETLIGGWCQVYRLRNGKETALEIVEVSLEEYQQRKSDGALNKNWAGRPATMIHKVAVSQALRAAFPKDYAGLYIQEEAAPLTIDVGEEPEEEKITQTQRQELFKLAREKFGEAANDTLKQYLSEYGLQSTTNMPVSVFEKIMEKLNNPAEEVTPEEETSPVPEQ